VSELRKATAQIRKVARVAVTDDKVQKEWERLHSSGLATGSAEFKKEFERRVGHRLHPKPDKLHLYVLAGNYTRQAAKRALKRNTTVIMMFEVSVGKRRLVFTERLTN
jgi:hypothetical protein